MRFAAAAAGPGAAPRGAAERCRGSGGRGGGGGAGNLGSLGQSQPQRERHTHREEEKPPPPHLGAWTPPPRQVGSPRLHGEEEEEPPWARGAAEGVGWGASSRPGPARPRCPAPLRRARRLPFLSAAVERFHTPEFGWAISPPKAPRTPSGGCRRAAGGARLPFGPVWGGIRGGLSPSRPRHRLLGRDSKRKGI